MSSQAGGSGGARASALSRHGGPFPLRGPGGKMQQISAISL